VVSDGFGFCSNVSVVSGSPRRNSLLILFLMFPDEKNRAIPINASRPIALTKKSQILNKILV
jgi:hypothetical protein